MKRKEIFKVVVVDFTKDKWEPAFDVENYENDIYVGDCNGSFSIADNTPEQAVNMAEEFTINEVKKYFMKLKAKSKLMKPRARRW